MTILKNAKIIKSSNRDFLCKDLETLEIITATAKGNLLKNEQNVVVGDLVQIEASDNLCSFQISSVLPRKNEIFRIFVREGRKKVIAANCDLIMIITSISSPVFKRGIIDRFLIRSTQWGIPAIVVFNKMDQYNPLELDLILEEQRLNFCPNYKVDCFEISAKNPQYQNHILSLGIKGLKEKLKNKTALVVGQSGVGKSKTISALTEGRVKLKTNDVGKVGKGMHTTTWSEIIDCQEFDLIDSPGIKSFSLDDILAQDLDKFYPDLAPYFSKCKFSNCQHLATTIGCSLAAWYNSKLPLDLAKLSRLESYLRVKEEIGEEPNWKKKDY